MEIHDEMNFDEIEEDRVSGLRVMQDPEVKSNPNLFLAVNGARENDPEIKNVLHKDSSI